jgi:DNA primase
MTCGPAAEHGIAFTGGGRIVDVNIDELRRRLPPAKQMASDLYGVKWRRDRARCPRGENHAHGDRDPSFAYLSKEDRLHCFSQRCFGDKPVDALDFVGQMERCDFPSAARRLADVYGGAAARNSKRHNVHPPSNRNSARDRLESEVAPCCRIPHGKRRAQSTV